MIISCFVPFVLKKAGKEAISGKLASSGGLCCTISVVVVWLDLGF